MGVLYNRDLLLKVGAAAIPLQLADPLQPDKPQVTLHTTFSVHRTSNKDPNTASVTIFNLNPTNRALLNQGAELLATPKTAWNWPLLIEAGYVGNRTQIFSGDIRRVDVSKQSTDWIATIEADDGGRAYVGKRLNAYFGPGATVRQILQAAANALGVGLGNSAAKFAAGNFRKGFVNFKKGVAVHGLASKILDKYVTSAGFKWSIQDGQLQVLGPDEALLDIAVILTPTTGLIGTPSHGEKGSITATSLLQGDIKPGRVVHINCVSVKARYLVTDVTHSGDTHGGEWYSNFEAIAA